MANRVFLLEDEENVGSTLKSRLESAGYDVSWAKSLKEARSHFGTINSIAEALPSLALLDVNLPDGNGFEFAAYLQNHSPSVPVIFLTAASAPEDRIQGLELGAEDYVVKPFHFKELLLRIQNVLKRSSFVSSPLVPSSLGPVQIGKAFVTFSQYTLLLKGPNGQETIRLSNKECALLKLLYEKRDTVVSRDEILNLIWSEEEFPTPRTVDNFIVRLRKHIEPNPDSPTIIRSIRGVGYSLELP